MLLKFLEFCSADMDPCHMRPVRGLVKRGSELRQEPFLMQCATSWKRANNFS